MKFLFAIFIFISLDAQLVHSQSARKPWINPLSSPSGSTDFKKKIDDKAKNRWTLADWLTQKDKNKMMDLWLGMYAPSPYEFILSVDQMAYETKTENPLTMTPHKSVEGSLAFYALILGIEAKHENNSEEDIQNTSGQINLRVMGNANQGTHLNISYGARKRIQNGTTILGQFVATEFDLYIQRHSGLHVSYRYDLPTDNDTFGQVHGSRTEGGAFFDIGFVRIFGNLYSDKFSTKTNSLVNTTERAQWQYGFKLYF